jgi:hypothetical protein
MYTQGVSTLVEGLVHIASQDPNTCPQRDPAEQLDAAQALVSTGLLSEILAFHQVDVWKMHPSWPSDAWGTAHAQYLTPALTCILSFSKFCHDTVVTL